MLATVTVHGAVVLAGLVAVCCARPHETSYAHSTAVFSIPSSHQAVMTVSESRVHHGHGLHIEREDPPKPYNFEYKVHDDKSHNYQERAESSDGKVVRGFYSLLEPHGEVRVVKYRADHDGFQSEVSRHGGKNGDSTKGGGLGATLGEGAAHDIGSHGLGKVATPTLYHKEAIPIHEDLEEGTQWAAIEGPGKAKREEGKLHAQLNKHLVQGHVIEEISSTSKRIPEQILLQQQKKAALQQQHHHKHQAQHIKQGPKFHPKRPLGPPGPPRGPPRGPPFHRGPKVGPKGGPHKRGLPPHGRPLGPPQPQIRRDVAARREARPPATPCQCADPQHQKQHLSRRMMP